MRLLSTAPTHMPRWRGLFVLALVAGLAKFAEPAYCQSDDARLETRLLDRMLAESDQISRYPPRPLQREFMALPSVRKLMARLLVTQAASEHLNRVVLDERRSVQQRVYALHFLFQQGFTPEYRPTAWQLDDLCKKARDPLLEIAAHRACSAQNVSAQDQELAGTLLLRERELQRRSPWGGIVVGVGSRMQVDRELMSEILAILPRDPQIVREPPEGQIPVTRLEGPGGRDAFVYFFRDHTKPDAIRLLLDEFPAASSGRKNLFLWVFGTYAFYARPSRGEIPDRILALVRELLLTDDASLDPAILTLILTTSGTGDDAKVLVEALRKTQHEEWRSRLRGRIVGMVQANLWPRAVPLDPSLFPGGIPKPPAPPRTKPAYRGSPAELLKDPYPAFKDPPKQERSK